MTIKVGTNQTNQADCPTPIEPNVTPPKAEEAKPSAAEARKAHDEMGWSDKLFDTAGRIKDLAGDVFDDGLTVGNALEAADIAADAVKQIPVIGDNWISAGVDDLTDVLVDAHEQIVENGKPPLELLGDVPGAMERVADRTNEKLREYFGDDAPQMASSFEDIDWNATLAMATLPQNQIKAVTGTLLAATEVLRENENNIEFLKNTNVGRKQLDILDTLGEVAGAGITLGIGTFFPPSYLLVATDGGGVGERIVNYTKEALSELSDPDTVQDMMGIALGPPTSVVESMQPGQVLKKEISFEAEFTAKAGAKGVVKAETELRKLENGEFHLTLKLNGAAAAAAGIESLADGDVGGELGVEKQFIIKDPAIAAALARPDATAQYLRLARDGKIDGVVESKSLKFSNTVAVEAEILSIVDINYSQTVAVDPINGALEVSAKGSAALSLMPSLQVYAEKRENPQLDTAMKVFEEIAGGKGFSGSISAEGKVEATTAGDVSFVLTLAANVKSRGVDVDAKVVVEVDLDKAATALNMSKDQLEAALANKTIDPEKFWQDLPQDIVQIKPEFKTTTYTKSEVAGGGPIQASSKMGEEKSYNAQEFLSFVLGQSASDRQISQIR